MMLGDTLAVSRFSGCGGNGNNFVTGENCVKNCGGDIKDNPNSLHTKHISERVVLPTMKTTTTPKPTSTTADSNRKRKMKRVKIERGRAPSEARSRAILNRARLTKSRMSSSSSVSMVSSSTEQSVGGNELEALRPFRRPTRMVNSQQKNTSSNNLYSSSSNSLYPPRLRLREFSSLGRRVDEVMKAPPNMKGGLVVIKSYCRYRALLAYLEG